MQTDATILVLGDPDSIWLKRYIENVLVPRNLRIIVSDADTSLFSQYYNSVGVESYSLRSAVPEPLRKTGRAETILILLNTFFSRRNEHVDCVHVQYASRLSVRIALLPCFRTAGKILSFWGSDLLRIDEEQTNWLSKRMRAFDAITLQGKTTMENAYQQRFNGRFSNKTFRVVFPDDAEIDLMPTGRNSKELAKRRLGLPTDKLIISVGYNASSMQQHIKALEHMAALPQNEKQAITLLFPMTYPANATVYAAEVASTARSLGFECRAIVGFQTEEVVSLIRVATDIFVHAQPTDASSASVVEFLRAGAVVVNPSWIDYSELKMQGVVFLEYDDFSELPATLDDIIAGRIRVDVDKNAAILSSGMSSAEKAATWSSALNTALNAGFNKTNREGKING